MGRQEELRAAGDLVGDALGGMVGVVGDVHRAVSGRVDAFLPPAARPVTLLHDTIAGAVYTGVAAAHRLAPARSAEVLARTGPEDAPPPSQSRVGRAVLPAVNGLWGDRVAERQPVLAVPMAARVGDRDLPLDAAAIRAAFPGATSRVVVFVHGLCESDAAWWLGTGAEPGRGPGSYGDLLRADLGLTPVYLRYNTGLRVSENGRALSRLLSDLHAAWPVPLAELDLVGHSMGGLVARSACHYGDEGDAAWVPAVRAVVTLGTPHLGAPLEQGAHATHWLLRRLPETEPLSRLLGVRSAGIKDLRYGAVVEEDWHGQDPDAFLRDCSTDVPFLEHATYYYVAASLTRDVDHPAGRLVGDGLVRYPSASGQGRSRRLPFEMGNGAHLGGLDHLSLLNHPDVYRRLAAWLNRPPEPLGPAAAAR
jgi:hypothetical protein